MIHFFVKVLSFANTFEVNWLQAIQVHQKVVKILTWLDSLKEIFSIKICHLKIDQIK